MQMQTTQPLSRYSQYVVRLMAPRFWRTGLRNSSSMTYFWHHRIYQLQPAETESAPNVIRLLSAETKCPPKVPIYPHSAPKPKPKFGRPLNRKLYMSFQLTPDRWPWMFKIYRKIVPLKVYGMFQLILCNVAKHYRARNAYQNDQHHLFWHFHASQMSNWMNLWFGRLLFEHGSNFHLYPVFMTFFTFAHLI